MPTTLSIPRVYGRRRVRPRRPRRVRTDVAGLIGFEARLRPLAVELTGPPDRHRVAVRVARVQIDIDGRRAVLDSDDGAALILSQGAGHPVGPGQARAYAIAAYLAPGTPNEAAGPRPARLIVVTGPASGGAPPAPDDAQIRTAVDAAAPGASWRRLAVARLRRDAGGQPWLTVHPATGPIVCEDWQDFLVQVAPTADGTRLAAAARAFFANGGDRCHVATVRRPDPTDTAELEHARRDMIGSAAAGAAVSEADATGLARLALIEEVALVAAPDLHSQRPAAEPLDLHLPPSAADAGFRPCGPEPPAGVTVPGARRYDEPLYDLDAVYSAQRDLLLAAAAQQCGPQLVLAPPVHRDPATGSYGPPAPADADAWLQRFVTDPQLDDRIRGFAALYWPWLLTQETVGAVVGHEPPLGFALGVIARRDLAQGPHVAAAGEPVEGTVGVTHPVDDATFTQLYDPAAAAPPRPGGAVNPLRPTRGAGVVLWGSRTLAADRWLRHLPVRRGLTAIERQACDTLRAVVFEPHTPLLWLRVTNLLVNLLLGLFESGALRGAQPEEAFSVRCDEGLNPTDAVAAGLLTCEVRVALAAPAEFISFRLAARSETSTLEVTET